MRNNKEFSVLNIQVDVMTVVAYVINGLILIIAYFVKSHISDIKLKLSQLELKHNETDTKLNELHVTLPSNYATKDDLKVIFIRLDDIQRDLSTGLLSIHATLLEVTRSYKNPPN